VFSFFKNRLDREVGRHRAPSQEEDVRFVSAVYRGVLRREADGAERQYWVWRLSRDLTPAQVVEAFLESEEFRVGSGEGLHNDVPNSGGSKDATVRLVSGLYRGVLGRQARDEELRYWAERLCGDLGPGDVVEEFLRSDEFRKRSKSEFVPSGHYYSPIVDRDEADKYLRELEAKGVSDTLPGININRREMAQAWMAFLPFMLSCPFGEKPGGGFRYGFINPMYSWGDGCILYSMLRYYRPRRIIEIGSGWSSACIVDTAEHFLDKHCDITFIEPFPQTLREVLGAAAENDRTRLLEARVQDVPLELFDSLGARDVLFIDSTHVLRTGSDVCRELCEILPRLAPGVIVHFHDMFWPFEYPRKWVVEENRSWNELYAVRLMLTNNQNWKVIMFNHYMAQLERELIEKTWPAFYNNPGGALWIEKQ
jgi:predicted O-methyltransferase YrrM